MGGKGGFDRRGLCRIDLVGDGRTVSVMFEAALTRKRALGLPEAVRKAGDGKAAEAARAFLERSGTDFSGFCMLKEAGGNESGCFLAARRSPEGAGFRWDIAGQNFTSGNGFLDMAFPAFRSAGAGEGFRNLDGPLPAFPCFGCVDMLGVLMEMERHAPLSPRRALKAAIR